MVLQTLVEGPEGQLMVSPASPHRTACAAAHRPACKPACTRQSASQPAQVSRAGLCQPLPARLALPAQRAAPAAQPPLRPSQPTSPCSASPTRSPRCPLPPGLHLCGRQEAQAADHLWPGDPHLPVRRGGGRRHCAHHQGGEPRLAALHGGEGPAGRQRRVQPPPAASTSICTHECCARAGVRAFALDLAGPPATSERSCLPAATWQPFPAPPNPPPAPAPPPPPPTASQVLMPGEMPLGAQPPSTA